MNRKGGGASREESDEWLMKIESNATGKEDISNQDVIESTQAAKRIYMFRSEVGVWRY